MAITQISLTSGTTWTVPSDFDPNSNTVECIEGGQDGTDGHNGSKTQGGDGSPGGRGGRFEGINNFQVNPGDVCTISIGANGASPGATWISKTGSAPTTASDGCLAQQTGSVGDYGNDAGTPGSGTAHSGATPGVGGIGSGAGGNAGSGSGRTPGSMSPAWDSGIGPGTGGTAGAYNGGDGGNGTNYGAGGGGGGGGRAGTTGNAGGTKGTGTPGIIVIRYTPRPSGGIQFRAFIWGH